ncbi:MAG: nucleotidyltransferase domain-containing protein [Desulfobacterales bacterium]
MIRAQRLPANILDLLPAALDYLETHPKIIFAYLFGGLAKHRPFPLSDVDIAVYLKRGSHLAECKLDILGRLMDILHTDEIDLVILNRAGLSLAMGIVKSKKIIVDKNPFERHLYESLIMRKSFDFSFRELNHLRRRYMHG